MDGRDPTVIVTGLVFPYGTAIDFQSSRLYWADGRYDRVQSSDLEGTDMQTVIKLPRGSGTIGIALHGGRINCTNWILKQLQSFTMAGQDVRVLHQDTHGLCYLAIICSRSDLPRSRTNHCANQQCNAQNYAYLHEHHSDVCLDHDLLLYELGHLIFM